MLKRLFILLPFVLCFSGSTLWAQTDPDEQDDPFINNPFFSKPLDELLNSGDNKKEHQKEEEEENHKEHEYHSDSPRRYVHRINNEGLDFGGFIESGPYSSNELYASYPVLPMIHFNRVNGFFLGIREERMQWYNYNSFIDIGSLHPHGMIGYSFGQDELQYEAGLERYFGYKKHLIIGAELYNATTTDDYWRTGLTETTITSLFAGYDYLDYYKQSGWGAYLLARTRHYFEGGLSYNQNQYNSLGQVTDYHIFGKGDHYRPNPQVESIDGFDVDTLDISSLTLSAEFNPKQILILPRFTFSLSGLVEFADPEYGLSDYSYTKLTTELISYLNIEPGAILKYRIRAGSITGDAPLMKEFQLGGPGNLRATPYKSLPFVGGGGNKMLLSNAEIQFGSSNSWNDLWVDLDDFYFSLFLDSGWTTSYDGTNTSLLDGFSEFDISQMEHNAGIGIGTNSVRAEVAWDLNNTSRAPMIWVRFNPTF